MQSSLYIGRFQPFHLGHLDAIRQILAKEDHVIIGIGSAQISNEEKNPWDAKKRIELIQKTLEDTDIPRNKYTIVPIPDINDFDLWCEHVESLVPLFDKVYTGSPIVAELFKKHGTEVVQLKTNLNISATKIRKRMKEDKNWEKLVPKNVAKLIKEWNALDHEHEHLSSI